MVYTASPRTRRTQLERRTEAGQRLLSSALALVVEKGVVRMTLGDVGDRAGYSRGLPAHHYGSKEGLLKALLVDIVESLRSRRVNAHLKPGLDSILGTIRMYLDGSGQRDAGLLAIHVLFAESFVPGSEIAVALDEFNHSSLLHFQEQIHIGVNAGEIRADIDPATQAVALLGAARGISAQFYLGTQQRNWKAVRDVTLLAIEMSLRPLSTPT